jgi:hypothetical protein
MSPEARFELGLMVAMDSHATGKEMVGEDAGLGHAIYAFLHLNVHMTILNQWE